MKWVAEVCVVRKVGRELKAYKDKKGTVLQLKKKRAEAKMYNKVTLSGQTCSILIQNIPYPGIWLTHPGYCLSRPSVCPPYSLCIPNVFHPKREEVKPFQDLISKLPHL